MQTIRRCLGALCRIGTIQKIPVDVMLHYESAGIKPIIKDLAPHDVPTYTPAVLIALMSQPVVTKDLGVDVVRFKGRMVDVAFWALEEEEGVMVDPLVTAV